MKAAHAEHGVREFVSLRILSLVAAVILSVNLVNVERASDQGGQPPAHRIAPNDLASPLQSLGGYFIENRGQVNDLVRYYLRGNPSVAFRDDGVMFLLRESGSGEMEDRKRPFVDPFESHAPARSLAYLLRFEGANKVVPVGRDHLPFNNNFFIGNDPARWHTDVGSYREVVYKELYGGVDLAYHATEAGVKHEFILAPAVDPSTINLSLEGADGVELDAAGDLSVHTLLGSTKDSSPIASQGTEQLQCSFVIRAALSYGFECDDIDKTRPIVIDPLIYSTYVGSTYYDRARSIAVDSSSNAFVIGFTFGDDFPTTPGVIDPFFSPTMDAFVFKVNPNGTSLVYSTYLGGMGVEFGYSIAIDDYGNAYLTGNTMSGNFPITPGAFDKTCGGSDAFVTKLNPTGSSLVYSTYLGGTSGATGGMAIRVDANGSAYVAGMTSINDFPVTPGAYDTIFGGSMDTFVTKFTPSGGSLMYSTFIGGSGREDGYSMDIDAAGNTYVIGRTWSTDFPVTPGAIDATLGGATDAFVAKLDSTGSSLLYSTYLGGSDDEDGRSVAADSAGNAYLSGQTRSADFPVTNGAFDTTLGGTIDAYLTKLDFTSGHLLYSTYLGGGDEDAAMSIALDSVGDPYVTGYTRSPDFPVTCCGVDATANGGEDIFLTRLNSADGSLVYSTFIGGSSNDEGWSVYIDSTDQVYITGSTFSFNFPTSPGAFQPYIHGPEDPYVLKLGLDYNSPPLASNPGVQGFTTPPSITHITDTTPEFNWTYGDPDGDPQVQYAVGVGTTPGSSDVWGPPPMNGNVTTLDYGGTPLNRGTDYYLSVKVKDKCVFSPEVQVGFHVNNIPYPPTIPTTPAQSSVITASSSHMVTWTTGGDTEGDLITYEWQVSTDNSFTKIIENSTTTATASTPFATSPSTMYYWRVRARDDYEPTTWSAYGNSPPGYWTFSTFPPPNSPPTIAIISPAGGEVWQQGESRAVTWTASDREDSPSSLVVYVNFTSNAGNGRVCGPLAGDAVSCAWTLPTINATGVVVNATVIDTGGLKGYDDSGPFTIRAPPAVNTPPTVTITLPVGGEVWERGSSHNVTWSMRDTQDSDANLTVYVNYTTGGTTTTIVAGVKGIERSLWTLPDIEATDVVVNVTVIDTGGLKDWAQSGPFEIRGPTSPPSVEVNYKPIVAAIFAIILLMAGVWSSRRRPWKGGEDGMAVVKAFTITSLPFVLAEAVTGMVSFSTRALRIPPVIDWGTAVDCAVLVSGLLCTVLRFVLMRRGE